MSKALWLQLCQLTELQVAYQITGDLRSAVLLRKQARVVGAAIKRMVADGQWCWADVLSDDDAPTMVHIFDRR